jgi:hypothetical protein
METANTSQDLAHLRPRREAVMVREIEREMLLLDTESNLIHKLNQTASFIWRSLGEVRSSEELARRLANEYEVEEHLALRDVVETLRRLMQLNLVIAA